jgi:hypothetical protein
MSGQRKDAALKDAIDLLITVLIVGVSLYPLYRDDLKRAQMRAEQWLHRERNYEAEALKQVQREISLMEHADGS